DYIWFNAHITSLTFANSAALAPSVTIHVTDSTVTFNNNGTDYIVNLPNTNMTFSTSAATASGTYAGGWELTFPKVAGGDPFMGGMMYDVPAVGLLGGTNPVTWTAHFSTDTGSVSLNWQWAAAVYTSAPSDPNQLNVLLKDGSGLQSGTPVAYESFVTGGARGGGGSNYTGSNSGTESVNNIAVVPEPSAAVLGIVGTLCLVLRRRVS
ncbi:MAG TPA: hypothetical protein VM511_00945, partial [Luteolibacter sp.]|nr:hypothetical protein [Luteolibacter sp.]